MHLLHAALLQIRNIVSYQSVRGPAFWVVTALIALALPSPIAAPVLLARLHRPNPTNQE